jgi:hypothetical protein
MNKKKFLSTLISDQRRYEDSFSHGISSSILANSGAAHKFVPDHQDSNNFDTQFSLFEFQMALIQPQLV